MRLPQWHARRLAAGLVGGLALVGATAVPASAAATASHGETKAGHAEGKKEVVVVQCDDEVETKRSEPATTAEPSISGIAAGQPGDVAKQKGERIDYGPSCTVITEEGEHPAPVPKTKRAPAGEDGHAAPKSVPSTPK